MKKFSYLIPCIIANVYNVINNLLEAAVERKFQLPTADVKFSYNGRGYKYIEEINKGYGQDVTLKFTNFNDVLLLKEFNIKGIKRVYFDDYNAPVQADPLNHDDITTVIEEINKLIP